MKNVAHATSPRPSKSTNKSAKGATKPEIEANADVPPSEKRRATIFGGLDDAPAYGRGCLAEARDTIAKMSAAVLINDDDLDIEAFRQLASGLLTNIGGVESALDALAPETRSPDVKPTDSVSYGDRLMPVHERSDEAKQRAWNVLRYCSMEDDPTTLGERLRAQMSWLSLFDRQTAAGNELRDVDLEGSIDDLRTIASEVDDLLLAYEEGNGAPYQPFDSVRVPSELSAKPLGFVIRKIAARATRALETFAATGKRPAALYDSLMWLVTIALEVDHLGGWFGEEAPIARTTAENPNADESYLDAAAEE